MKCTFVTLALLAATATATAGPTPITLLGGPENYTATISMNHASAGDFSDAFFIDFSGLASVNGQLSATFRPLQAASNQIVFNDVELDGVDFTMSTRSSATTVTNFVRLTPVPTSGGFLLRVAGCAGACDGQQQAGTAITASYSGTLNLQRIDDPAQNVPEPASLPLAVAALGLGGLAMGRRKIH